MIYGYVNELIVPIFAQKWNVHVAQNCHDCGTQVSDSPKEENECCVPNISDRSFHFQSYWCLVGNGGNGMMINSMAISGT